MNAVGLAALAVLGGFFMGSIPFGVIVSRVFYGRDIRAAGSGNIGAANALRTLGKKGAAAVLVCDAIKGALPVVAVLARPRRQRRGDVLRRDLGAGLAGRRRVHAGVDRDDHRRRILLGRLDAG